MIKGKIYLIIISGILLLNLILAFQFSLFGSKISWNENSNEKKNLFLSQSASDQYISEWNKTWSGYGVCDVSGIGVDSSDNIFIVGNIKSLNTEKDDIFLLKYNKTGDLQWNRTWGGPNYDKAYDLVIDSSDNIYIVGGTGDDKREIGYHPTYVQLINSDIIIIKYNNLGIEEWSTTWGENFDEVGRSIALDSEGNIYIVGDSYKNDLNDYDLIFVKFNSSGNYQWHKIWPKIWPSYDVDSLSGRGVAIDSSNNIYILGQCGWCDRFFLLKYNNSGIEEWNRSFLVFEVHYVSKIIVDSSDKIYILGDKDGHGYPRTIFLIKMNCLGNDEWRYGYMDYGSSALYFPYAEGIAVDSVDNVYVVGRPIKDLCGIGGLIKFNSSGNLIFNTTTIEGKLIDIDSEDNLFISDESGSDVLLKKYKIDVNGESLADKQGDIIILIIILSLISVISVGIILMIRKKVKERKVEDLKSELSKQTSI